MVARTVSSSTTPLSVCVYSALTRPDSVLAVTRSFQRMLARENTIVNRLRYLYIHTMGCPHTFEYRRQELAIVAGHNDPTQVRYSSAAGGKGRWRCVLVHSLLTLTPIPPHPATDFGCRCAAECGGVSGAPRHRDAVLAECPAGRHSERHSLCPRRCAWEELWVHAKVRCAGRGPRTLQASPHRRCRCSKDTKDDVQVVVPGEETASVWSVDHWITALNVWAAWALAEWRLQPLWNADRTHRGGAPLHGYACMCGAAQSLIGQPCVPDLTLRSTQTSRRCLGDP